MVSAATARGLGAVGLALVLSASVGACSGGSTTSTPEDDAASSSVSPSVDARVKRVPELPPFTGESDGSMDLRLDPCPTAAGSQVVRGTIKNSTGTTQDYLVTVNWIRPTGAIVGGGHAVLTKVKPKATRPFRISVELHRPATSCLRSTLRGHAG